MPWTAPDPLPDGFDWTQQWFQQEYADAINERIRWAHSSFTVDLGQTDVGDRAAGGTAGYIIRHVVRTCRVMAGTGSWIHPTETVDAASLGSSSANRFETITTANWLALADLNGGAGFEVRKPREINKSTTPGTLGQRGRDTTTRRIYEHDGTAWVDAPAGAVPDVLTTYVLNENGIGPGDYMGTWIWRDLKKAINIFTRLNVPTTAGRTQDGGSSVGAPHASPSSAKSAAETAYNADAPSAWGSGIRPRYLAQQQSLNTGPASYSASLSQTESRVIIPRSGGGVSVLPENNPTLTDMEDATYTVFAWGANHGTGSEYDALGSGIVAGAWAEIYSGDGGAMETLGALGDRFVVHSFITGLSLPGTVWPADPAAPPPAVTTSRGFATTAVTVVVEPAFDFHA